MYRPWAAYGESKLANLLFVHELVARGKTAYASDPGMTDTGITRDGSRILKWAGRVLSRDQIMEAVRGRELDAFDRSIDVHMGRIRAAIEVDAKNPKRILTVRGVGYVFARQQD